MLQIVQYTHWTVRIISALNRTFLHWQTSGSGQDISARENFRLGLMKLIVGSN
jgi:hypothetical protein